jgi:hypothetical protein
MAKQIIFATPSADWCAVDNSNAPTFPTLSNSTNLGYDTTAPGATSQANNGIADTGSTALDINGNDTVYADPSVATVKGNPVQNTQPTYATVTKVINSALTGICVAWKNPALIL